MGRPYEEEGQPEVVAKRLEDARGGNIRGMAEVRGHSDRNIIRLLRFSREIIGMLRYIILFGYNLLCKKKLFTEGGFAMRKGLVIVLLIAGLIVGGFVGAWAERQPHMKAALESLHKAKMQLEKAEPDKGGHRVKAIELVTQAIEEVKMGIEYDNKH